MRSADPVIRGTGALLCLPTLEGGPSLHAAACAAQHGYCVVLCNRHISVTEMIVITSSKVWTIMRCDGSMESHVITSRVASVQEQMQAQAKRGREDPRGEEWSFKGPRQLRGMAIEGDKDAR